MGAREDDRPQLSGWIRTLTAALDEPLSLRRSDVLPIVRSLASRSFRPLEALRAGLGMVRYARARLADTETPITRALRGAVEAGDITEDEATSTWLLLFIAGHETSANLIANAVHALRATHESSPRSSQIRASWRRRSRKRSAGTHRSRSTPRMAHTPARVADVDVAVGSSAYLSIRDANRDPLVVADGDDFRVGRVPEVPHLSFGLGTHFCLGAFLARTEVAIGLQHVLERAPELRLDGPATRRKTITVSGFENLPLRASPRPV